MGALLPVHRCRSWGVFCQLCWDAVQALYSARDELVSRWRELLHANELDADQSMYVEMPAEMVHRLFISQDELWKQLDKGGSSSDFSTWAKVRRSNVHRASFGIGFAASVWRPTLLLHAIAACCCILDLAGVGAEHDACPA